MPTVPYFNSKGERLPSVTTVLGNLGWKANGLKFWAYNLGKEGKDLNDTTAKLCEAGSWAHAMADADTKRHPIPEFTPEVPEEVRQKALGSFRAYLDWKRMVRLQPTVSEVSMASDELGFGGTLDQIAVFDGGAGLLDLKSAKELWGDHVVQVAAYDKLWTTLHPDVPLERWFILRWDPNGGFHFHSLGKEQVVAGWEVFKCCLTIHRLKKLVKP